MIFMQQKHFNNPRIYNNHRSVSASRIVNSTIRQPRVSSAISNYENQTLTNVENSVSLGVSANEPSSGTSRFSLNQRLTSIGGLFATLSIIITGALLYAIFTAKSQDKWYYISAVLINISLLFVLMIGAILFDKYYLKKYPNNASSIVTSSPVSSSSSSSSSSSNANRIQNVSSALNTNTYVHNSMISSDSAHSIDHSNCNHNAHHHANQQICISRNDVPPQYPDLSPLISQNDKDKDTTRRSQHHHQLNAHVINEINDDKSHSNSNVKLDSPLNQPPNYFDLYPMSNKTSEDNQNRGSSSVMNI